MNAKVANSWSSIVTKNEDVIVKAVSDENEAVAREQVANTKAQLLHEKEDRRRRYITAMERKHGLKQDLFDPTNPSKLIAKKGDFWCFMVERSNDDGPIARKLRSDEPIKELFINYLKLKYGYGWVERSEFKEEDCKFLYDMRAEKEREEYELKAREEEEHEKRKIEYKKAVRDEKQAMKNRVKSGEITREEYDQWKWALECEEDYEWESVGVSIWWK